MGSWKFGGEAAATGRTGGRGAWEDVRSGGQRSGIRTVYPAKKGKTLAFPSEKRAFSGETSFTNP